MELQQQLIYSHPVHPEHDTKLKASTTLALLHDWPHFITLLAALLLVLAVSQSLEIYLRYLKTKHTGGTLNYLNFILSLRQRKSVRISRIDA